MRLWVGGLHRVWYGTLIIGKTMCHLFTLDYNYLNISRKIRGKFMELFDKFNLMKSLMFAKSSKPKPIVVHINITLFMGMVC